MKCTIISRIANSDLFKLKLLWPARLVADHVRLQLWNLPKEKRIEWRKRIRDVLECPDRQHIPLSTGAGTIQDGSLIMHNGVKVTPLGYYGYPTLRMLKETGGIHEPQEERIFLDVLKLLPDVPTMLELGSYWAFYSLSFLKAAPKGRSFCVEPTVDGLESGKRHFEMNGCSGDFTQAYIGAKDNMAEDGIPIMTVDQIMEEKGISALDILHSDIQGFELEMLAGAEQNLRARRIAYVFISTHSNQLHEECVQKLKDYGYEINQSIDLDASYSFDGLIVARSPESREISGIKLSRRNSIT